MDSSQIIKVAGVGAGLACVMALAILRMVDGPTALQSVTWMVGVLTGATALAGAARAFADRGKP